MPEKIIAVILAGGKATRMGGEAKGLLSLAGKTLIEHIIARIAPQVEGIVLNVNHNPRDYEFLGLPLIEDRLPGYPGPLAGILAGMEWAKTHHPDCKRILSLPCDTPFLPSDLVERLANAGPYLTRASSLGQKHPVVGLWPVELAEALQEALTQKGIHKIALFTEGYRLDRVDFAAAKIDPFFNINSPSDLEQALEYVRS